VRALGIDVGVRRGLDLVVMEDTTVATTHRRVALDALPDLLAAIDVDVIAIDSPPGWAREGRSRRAERDLARLGISAYAAPTAERGEGHRFYEWMRVGFEVFVATATAGFPRYRKGDMRGTSIEVFPHASAVALAGCLPPAGLNKVAWRSSVLREEGIDPGQLRSPDQIDAALAAVTGLHALRGMAAAVGDPDEGVIVLPAVEMPTTRYQRRARPAATAPAPAQREMP
jgi:predicted nuclease with RNAse H fold